MRKSKFERNLSYLVSLVKKKYFTSVLYFVGMKLYYIMLLCTWEKKKEKNNQEKNSIQFTFWFLFYSLNF